MAVNTEQFFRKHFSHKVPSCTHDPVPLKDHFGPTTKGPGEFMKPLDLSEKEIAAHRQGLARKLLAGDFVRFGRTTHPHARGVVDWVKGNAPHPGKYLNRFPAPILETAHDFNRGLWFFALGILPAFWWKSSQHCMRAQFQDYGLVRESAYGGIGDGMMRKIVGSTVPNKGSFVSTFDPHGHDNYDLSKSADMFEGSLSRSITPLSWFGSLSATEAKKFGGFGVDPNLEAEYASAQKMLEELKEAKTVGGPAARDEWIAHYKKRIDDKKTIPRFWYDPIREWPDHKHGTLLCKSEYEHVSTVPHAFFANNYRQTGKMPHELDKESAHHAGIHLPGAHH